MSDYRGEVNTKERPVEEVERPVEVDEHVEAPAKPSP